MRRASLWFLYAGSMAGLFAACAGLRIDGVEFGWPVESELTVDASNRVSEKHYAVSFSVAPVALEEFQDSTALAGAKIRLLRNEEGYYFLTGAKFKNVYVLTPGEGTLTLKTRITVSETGLTNPALNQRPPYVQLLDGSAPARLLSSDDIVEEHK